MIKWGNQEASSDESDDNISIVTMHHWFKLLMPTLDLLVEIHVSNFYIPKIYWYVMEIQKIIKKSLTITEIQI